MLKVKFETMFEVATHVSVYRNLENLEDWLIQNYKDYDDIEPVLEELDNQRIKTDDNVFRLTPEESISGSEECYTYGYEVAADEEDDNNLVMVYSF